MNPSPSDHQSGKASEVLRIGFAQHPVAEGELRWQVASLPSEDHLHRPGWGPLHPWDGDQCSRPHSGKGLCYHLSISLSLSLSILIHGCPLVFQESSESRAKRSTGESPGGQISLLLDQRKRKVLVSLTIVIYYINYIQIRFMIEWAIYWCCCTFSIVDVWEWLRRPMCGD